MTSAISIQNVTKTFGPKVAVGNLNLEVPQGSLCGFIGPNGAGKTTTIRMVMSIIFPDSGDIRVLGKASAIESKDRIGYLPEERGLYRKMRVGAFLTYMARLKGVDNAGLDKKVRGWLDRIELGATYRKKCEELSKGMQQKVQFIASVIHEPDLLIFDEPFSGLDPVNRRLLRELIDEQHDAGRTVIFSTHAMYEAEQLCDHLFMINLGAKVLDLPMQDVWRRYDPRSIAVEPVEPVDASVRAAWGSLAGVREVFDDDGVLDIRLSEDADVPRLMSEIARSGRLRRIELRRPSLEDVFFELVGERPEAIAGSKAPGTEVAAHG